MQEITQKSHINNQYEKTLLLNYASETNRRNEIFKELFEELGWNHTPFF